MKFKNRVKAALKSFINPSLIKPKTVVQVRNIEPEVVLENKLLAGKNVLITGAGQNIGRSIAIEMAKQGANIYFTDIDKKKIENVEQELKKYPIQSQGFLSDIANRQDVDSLFCSLQSEQILIDILVNNVGIHDQPLNINTLELEEVKQVFDTNVFGGLYLSKIIANRMIEQHIKGSIIFITSIHHNLVRRCLSYSASKASLVMIIKELAVELAPYKIRVNGIAPGFVWEDKQELPVFYEKSFLHQTSINPCYIGRAALYLASDYFSQFTTGSLLKIDAGLSLYSHLT